MNVLHLDIETYASVSLKKAGLCAYAQADDSEILIAQWGGYRQDGWDALSDRRRTAKPPPNLVDALQNADEVWAHNARFEMEELLNCWGIEVPQHKWRCTQVLAYSLALPGALKDVGAAIGLPSEFLKSHEGARLISRFSVPQKVRGEDRYTRVLPEDDPERFRAFVEYCRQDVVAEMAVHKVLSRWDTDPQLWADWRMDWDINNRGWPVDHDLVEALEGIAEALRGPTLRWLQEHTGLENPNSRDQMLQWLKARGYRYDGLTAFEVQDALERSPGIEVERVLRARQEISKASLAKVSTLRGALSINPLCPDRPASFRGGAQFLGAQRTGRWAGRVVQPQNLASPKIREFRMPEAIHVAKTQDAEFFADAFDSPSDALSTLVRPCFAAPYPDETLVCADLSSIESVMLAWASGCETILRAFRDGKDTYKLFASALYGVPYDDVTPGQRKFAKPPVLGCGYGLGAKGLVKYAEGMSVPMSEDDAEQAVWLFRREYAEITQYWNDCTDAFFKALVFPGETHWAGPRNAEVSYTRDGPFVFCTLPSGRRLAYVQPKILDRDTPWGEKRPTITYMGMNQYTRKWERLSTHGGKLVENIVQAIARDVLRDGLYASYRWFRQAYAGRPQYGVVGHVHDEIITLVPEEDGEAELVGLIHRMTSSSPWCQDAPIGAAGWIGRYYRKE